MQLIVALSALLAVAGPPSGRPAPGTRIAVQPIDGEGGPALRKQIAKLLHAKGFRVVTSLPAVSGTSQYPGLARDRRLAGFVVASAERRRTRHIITFLVWNGATGGVQGECTISGPPKKIPKILAKDLWKKMGPLVLAVKTPPSDKLPPAPTMRINAGDPL